MQKAISQALEETDIDVIEKQPEKLPKMPFLILLAAIILLPIFFVPIQGYNFLFGKFLLFASGVLLSFCIWALSRLKDGKFVFPGSWILGAAVLIVVVSFLSTIFSGSFWESFLGQGFETGTLVAISLFLLVTFLIPLFFKTKDRIFYSYLAFFGVFFIISFFHAARLIWGPGLLPFNVLVDTTSNVIGKWNDLGIFFGLAAILSLVTVELIPLNKIFRVLIYAALLISLFFLAVVNFSTIWIILAVFSVIFFVYLFSFANYGPSLLDNPLISKKTARKISGASLLIVAVSLVFILGGVYIGNIISAKFNLSQIEARPSFGTTLSIAKNTLKNDPIFGVGPNRFVRQWLLFKDPAVNSSVFWNVDFNYGVGLFPSHVVTTGLLGIISWFIFFLIFLYAGFKAIFISVADRISSYFIVSSFLGSLFLWVFNIFYAPSVAIVALTYIFTGLFIASLYQEGIIKSKVFVFAGNSRANFVSVLVLILILISSVALEYLLVEKYVSQVYFEKGINTFNQEGNVDKAEGYVSKAVSISKNDLFYRFLTETGIVRLGNLLSQNSKDMSADILRNQFQKVLGATISNAKEAININPTNYENWLELGRVYEAIVPLKIDGAYENAKSAYGEAVKVNPKNPYLQLALSKLEVARGSSLEAKKYINEALNLKNNYTEAVFLLSQIETAEGNIKGAISSVEAATMLSPGDPSLFFQLGILRYNNKDYPGAIAALEQAVGLNQFYANARYFLGLSYEKSGRRGDAIKQFEEVKKTNPNNEEVELILNNLKAGRSSFSNASDSKPEKRSKLPVEESKSSR